jgi:hypothetical protein
MSNNGNPSAFPARNPTPNARSAPIYVAAALTALFLVGGLFAVDPLRDAVTRARVTDAWLELSPAFVVLAPLNNTLDALTLLSLREHITLLIALVCAYAVWRIVVASRRSHPTASNGPVAGQPDPLPPRWVREVALAAACLMILFAVFATTTLVARPMAALRLTAADSDLVVVDFHSHTSASHDGRPGFVAEYNREWHHSAGFNVAYVTDHFVFAGAEAGMAANPPRASDGTVLLSGVECLEGGEHVNVLGVTAADSGMLHGHYLSAEGVQHAVDQGRPKPIILQTIPGPLDRVPRPGMPGVLPVDGIEISDGAPRGLNSADQNHATILRIADSLELAVVSGSDHHGWGRTAAAWSLVAVPGWRQLGPAALEARIEQAIAADRRHASRVIERVRPIWPSHGKDSGIAGPVLLVVDGFGFLGDFAWQLVMTRSWLERLSWLVWIWAVALVYRRWRA